jgi:PAS domain S-box-containing protein
MKAPPNHQRIENVATVVGWILFILATLVLLGLALDLRWLQSFIPEKAGIKANSAAAMMLASVALLRRRDRLLLPLLSSAVFLTGALTLCEYYWQVNLGIDEFLLRDKDYVFYPGRISQYTSVGYMLLGASLLPMNSRHRVLRQLSRGFGMLTGALGALAIVSHAYDTHVMNLIRPQSNVAVPTALGFLIGAIGVQYATPSEGIVRLFHADNAGGAMLRRLLPIGTLLTFVLGYAVRGGQIHYRWESGFSLALVGLGVGACLLSGILLTAVDLERQDLSRRESESRFVLAAKAAPVMIWMSGTDKLRTYLSDCWFEFTGHPLTADAGNSWAERVHPEDLTRCLDTYAQCFDRREQFRIEYRVRRYDGAHRWILDFGVPRFDEDGSFVGFIGIAVDVTDRKLAEETLRQSEARFRDLAVQSRTTHWEVDTHGLFTYVSQVSEASWGYRPDEVMGRMYFYDIHPEEGREAFKAGVFGIIERKELFRDLVHAIAMKDGRIAWGSTIGIPLLNADGTLQGYRGSCTDVTERKLAEVALSDMSRKLIDAHEQERTRIGRELHDDIVQRLVLLAIQFDGIQKYIPDSVSEFRRRAGDLRNQTTEIMNDIQSLSHELHSSKLEYLGIDVAAKNFCREFGEHQEVEIDFQSHDLPATLPTELSLSLFRVLQEALRNGAKHSGVKRFEVRLWGSSKAVNLTVSDQGAGFEQEAAIKSTGLGLSSMQERLRLVGGELSINTQPSVGTTIHARVPFSSSSDFERASGQEAGDSQGVHQGLSV